MPSKRQSAELVKLARTFRVPSSVTDAAIYDFLQSLDCPRSLAVWLLYSNAEHQQLVDLDIDPMHYISATGFRDAYAATMFLGKSNFLKLDVSKKDAAYKKFFQYEELCKHTNSRFRNLALDPNYHGSNVWLLNATIQKIAKILGEFQPEEMIDSANWGPGVSTLLKGEHVSAINKFHSENGITRDLYSLVEPWFFTAYPLWWEQLVSTHGTDCFNYQVGNKIATVPKNSKTDRVIAVEPGLNLWFQKGVGSMIRRRLLRWGIDLRDQTRNQELARQASVSGLLATVDFSSASDSIAHKLVRELLPPDWFKVMELLRSPLGQHDKSTIRWEKFSSMGNGFTFELESLIFFAAALAVRDYVKTVNRSDADGEISVYGDDVILPTSCYAIFAEFSAFLGFKVNPDKSFYTGLFRESCGAHWFNGVDCKPIFLKERVQDVQAIYKLANSVRMLAHRHGSHRGCDSRFLNTWRRLFSRVPNSLRFGVSRECGDIGFIVNFDEARPALASYGIEGYYTSAMLEVGVNHQLDSLAVLLTRLRDVRGPLRRATDEFSTLAYGNTYTLRGRTKTRISRVLVPRWYNLGPWI